MNLIIMPVGKSKLIEGLILGDTLVINMTNNNSLIFPDGIDLYDIEKVTDIPNDSFGDLEDYNRIIFYTYKKYSDCKRWVDNFIRMFGEEKFVFMFKEL